MIIQQLQTKQINCAVYLLLTTQGQSHQSTHVSLRYNNLITLQHSLWTKNTSCLATNVVRINYHYCAIQNKGRRVTTQRKSANEPTMKDKSYHFPYWHGNAKLACQQDIIFQGQKTLFLSRIMFVYHDKSVSQH